MATFVLTTGAETFSGTGVNDVFQATPTTLNAGDSLTGGGGNDQLQLTATGTYTLAGLATFTGIQSISSTASNITLNVDATTISRLTGTIDLGGGTNTLSSSGNLDLSGTTLERVQTLAVDSGFGITVKAGQLSTGGGLVTTLKANTGSASVTAANTTLDVHGLTLSGISSLNASSATTTFTVDSAQLGVGKVTSVTGVGTGNVLQTAGSTLDVTGVTLTNVQTLKSTSTSGTTITDTNGSHTLVGGSGNDILIGNGGIDFLTGGGGSDIFRGTGASFSSTLITDLSTSDTINLTDVGLAGTTVSFAGNVITVKTGGVTKAQIELQGSYADRFSVVSDGASGVNVTYLGAAVTTPPIDVTQPAGGTAVHLTATKPNDILVGTLGDDIFVGIAKIPTTVSLTPLKMGQISINTNSLSLPGTGEQNPTGSLKITSDFGIDTLVNVSQVKLADGVLLINPDAPIRSLADLYAMVLHRPLDAGGLTAQLAALDAGASLTQIAAGMMAAPEAAFFGMSKVSDTDFVRQLYEQGLQREPDQDGFVAQMTALAQGVSRATLLANVASSIEASHMSTVGVLDRLSHGAHEVSVIGINS